MSAASTTIWSRRELLRGCGALLALSVTGCVPARIVLGAYPTPFKGEGERADQVLRAFAVTIIPGLPLDTPHLVRVFGDDFFPFAPYRGYFASDLCQRAQRRTGERGFDRLDLAARTDVVEEGLTAPGVTRTLYTGAILLIQAATYGGIYQEEGDVPFIGFEGFRYGPGEATVHSYPDPQRFLARPFAPDGNPG